jgi:hypothetical protein
VRQLLCHKTGSSCTWMQLLHSIRMESSATLQRNVKTHISGKVSGLFGCNNSFHKPLIAALDGKMWKI